MTKDDKALYPIGEIAELIGEHPETLRVWEKCGLIRPDRSGYQRRYSRNDLLRLSFIKYLIDEKGFNTASVKHLLLMYPCWYKIGCEGGKHKSSRGINTSRPCWKKQNTYCTVVTDKADLCCCCNKYKED